MVAVALAFDLLSLQSPTETKLIGKDITGDVRTLENFPSKVLNNTRTLRIYFPPGYEKSNARYPVLYMQDGQNLFDPALSAFSHNEWRVDETTEALIKAKLIPPMIVVGIDNTKDRADEYLPTRHKFGNSEGGGNADNYLKFVITEVKPYIDSHYRTRKDRDHTAIGGSSFGGVLSLYAGLTHSEVFSKVLAVSPSIWWDNRVMIKKIDSLKSKLPLKIWIDIGSAEAGNDAAQNRQTETDAADAVRALSAKDWKEGRDLSYFVDYGAAHTESAWARRFGMMLLFLYGTQR